MPPTDIEATPELHHVGVYSSEAFWAASVAAFLSPALLAGGGVVAVVTAEHRAALDKELLQAGIEVTQVRASGHYVTYDADEVVSGLLVDGRIDAERFQATANRVLDGARRHGAFRVYREMAPRLWHRGDVPNALRLGGLWKSALAGHPFPVLCLYEVDSFGLDATEAFLELCDQHAELAPVERYLPLVAPDPPRRGPALLEKQLRSSNTARQRREAESNELLTHVALVNHRMRERQTSFDEAITDRDLIGQATGILMVRWRVDPDAAARMLHAAATRSHRSLPDVARSVVDRQLRHGLARRPAPGGTGTGRVG